MKKAVPAILVLLFLAAAGRIATLPSYDPSGDANKRLCVTGGILGWCAGAGGTTGPTGAAGAAGATGAKGATGSGFTPSVTAYTADHTLDASESGNTITNTGATGDVVITFPAPAVGLRYRLERVANHEFYFFSYTGEKWYFDGQLYDDSGGPETLTIMANEVGATIDVECPATNTWVVTSRVGTWRMEGFTSQKYHSKLPRFENYPSCADCGKVLNVASGGAAWTSTINDIHMGNTFFLGNTETITAAGSNAATAYPVTAMVTAVTGPSAASGAYLPSAAQGRVALVGSIAATGFKLWPNSGDAINAGAVDASFFVSSGKAYFCAAVDSTRWLCVGN